MFETESRKAIAAQAAIQPFAYSITFDYARHFTCAMIRVQCSRNTGHAGASRLKLNKERDMKYEPEKWKSAYQNDGFVIIVCRLSGRCGLLAARDA
jgi:hypothetical protein